MDVVVTDDKNNNTIIIIFVFLFILLILALAIWLIIMVVPRNNVSLFGQCTHQNECASGLVCGKWQITTSPTGTVCLQGLEGSCDIDSDCSAGLTCQDHVCKTFIIPSTMTPPSTITTPMTFLPHDQVLQFDQGIIQQPLRTITSLNQLLCSHNKYLVFNHQ
ncbi:MAG TPA: hypothetical protein VLG50_06470 [Candidatus Saccharimonadales bacterium]|nr:hypothetical protein [Candidatus Saccharimonadales bacterium]